MLAVVAGLTLLATLPVDAGPEPSKRAPARPDRAAAAPCQRCHVAGLPLPAQHPDVAGTGIAECAGCHPSQAGRADPHPVAARLHRAHARARVDCTVCHAYAGARFSGAGHEGTLGTLDAAQYAMVRRAMETWARSPWLAGTHGSTRDLSCGACHGTQLIPDDNETVLNERCVGCHGGYATLAPTTRAKLQNPNVNPHGSHLGPEIACTVCHQGHRPSAAYCLGCHTNFRMPIPGGAATPAAPAPGR
jgi:hypothetical protein